MKEIELSENTHIVDFYNVFYELDQQQMNNDFRIELYDLKFWGDLSSLYIETHK